MDTLATPMFTWRDEGRRITISNGDQRQTLWITVAAATTVRVRRVGHVEGLIGRMFGWLR
jgi:hypothetical protein